MGRGQRAVYPVQGSVLKKGLLIVCGTLGGSCTPPLGRGRFLIDPDGVIQAMEVLTPPVGRNVAELIRQVKAFQHVRATGEATPFGWQPGGVALKPGPDLVGKVWQVWKPEMAF